MKNILIKKNKGFLKRILSGWKKYCDKHKHILAISQQPSKTKPPLKITNRKIMMAPSKIVVNPKSRPKSAQIPRKQKTVATDFSQLKNMTLKSKSKNWKLPHNKYAYPNIPIE